MKIELTTDAEKERTKGKNVATWALFSSKSMATVLRKAKEMGWKEKKVQVRQEHDGEDSFIYHIEPFERDCTCRDIVQYKDWFD